jgi:outer membrane receptor protein involved in Fe transport
MLLLGANAWAQSASVTGSVRDETGGALPAATVVLRSSGGPGLETVTDERGRYSFARVPAGAYQIRFALPNFATVHRQVNVPAAGPATFDATLHLSLNAEVTVAGKSTFTNLADAERPAENLVGIAQSASQGAITARQLDARPIMRAGEVLETVPGVIISQHSGEGKANQYYLRGFNLDHGTDFASSVAGVPVNMPTHAHGHGYSDLNFLIPELVSGVQFSKGPYFADQGDFATAGAASINYVTAVDRPIVRVGGGGQGFGRAFAAAAPRIGTGRVLAALEVARNDGPWARPDDYHKVNGVVRFSLGDTVNGLAFTAMGYRSTWNSTDQVPARAVSDGLIGRFGALDPSDGGDTSRYSGSFEWQRSRGNAATKVTAYGIGYDLNLFSNFTFFLDDPVHGDQFHQADHRLVSGGKLTHRRLARWGTRAVQHSVGLQLRNDDISMVGLFHTQARRLVDTTRDDAVVHTSAGVYAQNEVEWTPRLRTLAGLRADGYRFDVAARGSFDRSVDHAGLVSPKGGVVIGPFDGTEFYANAGLGYHSNDARVAQQISPLARAKGAEVGVRTVAVPHLQTTVAVWRLDLASELVFAGDAGTTEPGRPSHRHGIELANYYSPRRWLRLDADLALSRAHFTDTDPSGTDVPGAVESVTSAGATIDSLRHTFGSVRVRYFGSRPLVEDNSVRSKATTMVNVEGGYRIRPNIRLAVDVFNLFNAADSDIDYYYPSRLPDEAPDGVHDLHFHPALPRSVRATLVVGL